MEQEHILPGEIFALNKKLVESRVPPVSSLFCQDHLAVTGQFQSAGVVAVIEDVHPANFHTILADGDPGPQGDAMVRTLKLHLMRIKHHFLVVRRAPEGLAGGGPECAALQVLQINPCPPLVQAGIRLPARQGNLAPLAVSTPSVGNQHAGFPCERICAWGMGLSTGTRQGALLTEWTPSGNSNGSSG